MKITLNSGKLETYTAKEEFFSSSPHVQAEANYKQRLANEASVKSVLVSGHCDKAKHNK